MPHDFDDAIRLAPASEHHFSGTTSAAYTNMVGPYGGVTGAVLLNAVLVHPLRQGEPISMAVNFAGPLTEGPFDVEARPARTNRSTQHWTMVLTQQGLVAATGTAVLAVRRGTWSADEAVAPRDMPPAAGLTRAPFEGNPPWVQRYDMRFVESELPGPFDGQEQPHSYNRLWVRDDPPRPLDFASLAAICDCFFPRIFLRRRAFTPVGTVSLTTFFHADGPALAAQADRHVLGTARALTFRNGYFDQSGEIWSDAGVLLASTHQMVYFRE
jgi:acyl-CoA thioesterase